MQLAHWLSASETRIQRCQAACKRRKNRKEPFTNEMIEKIVRRYGSSDNLIHLRFLVICVLGFTGFFRISELLDLQVSDLNFKEDGMKSPSRSPSQTKPGKGTLSTYPKHQLQHAQFIGWINTWRQQESGTNPPATSFATSLKPKRATTRLESIIYHTKQLAKLS